MICKFFPMTYCILDKQIVLYFCFCSKQIWNVISWEIWPCSLWELFQCSPFSPLAMNWHPTESFVEWTKVWINFYNPQKWGFQSSSSPCTNMPNSPCQYGIGPIALIPVRVKTVQNVNHLTISKYPMSNFTFKDWFIVVGPKALGTFSRNNRIIYWVQLVYSCSSCYSWKIEEEEKQFTKSTISLWWNPIKLLPLAGEPITFFTGKMCWNFPLRLALMWPSGCSVNVKI